MTISENCKRFQYFNYETDDHVYSNTRVPAQVNTSEHELDTSQHESTGVNMSQHESDTSQHE